MGSAKRFKIRQERWVKAKRSLPRTRHYMWWLLHNCVSHPVLGFVPSKGTVWFHDWTSMHLNLRKKLRPSKPPVIPSYAWWLLHNTVGHLAIGLLPTQASFSYHDKTCEKMNVRYWV